MQRGDAFPPFRFDLQEMSGAVGDLGTLVPLMIALVTVNHLSPVAVFTVVGVAYLINAAIYRLPIPVQPLKAVSATAIAMGLSAGTVSAAGLVMGAVLLILAVTNLVTPVARLFPHPIVRGIQAGVGLLLLKSALTMIQRPLASPWADLPAVHLLVALVAAAVLLVSLRYWPGAAGILLLASGLAFGLFTKGFDIGQVQWRLSLPQPHLPMPDDLWVALTVLVIPQLPLTLGNSVVALHDAAQTYFGARARNVVPRTILWTIGIGDILAGIFGGMPICHGAGGLTAHVRLGARSGGAPLMLGLGFLTLGIALDGAALPILSLLPFPVLGVLLAYVGVQHAFLARDVQSLGDRLVVITVAGLTITSGNIALGYSCGFAVYAFLMAWNRWHAGRVRASFSPPYGGERWNQ
jgi:SulP family sulfate permease